MQAEQAGDGQQVDMSWWKTEKSGSDVKTSRIWRGVKILKLSVCEREKEWVWDVAERSLAKRQIFSICFLETDRVRLLPPSPSRHLNRQKPVKQQHSSTLGYWNCSSASVQTGVGFLEKPGVKENSQVFTSNNPRCVSPWRVTACRERVRSPGVPPFQSWDLWHSLNHPYLFWLQAGKHWLTVFLQISVETKAELKEPLESPWKRIELSKHRVNNCLSFSAVPTVFLCCPLVKKYNNATFLILPDNNVRD